MSLGPRLSVLDQSPVAEGATGAEALRNTLDLARLAEELGYHRYRFAEHHGGPSPAGASPEALIGPIAAATARVRVSSGGVMLPHYSPMTTYALERDRRQAAPDDFPEQLAELLAYLDDRLPADHPFARLARVLPGRPEGPEPRLLGSSAQSGVWAAQLGLPLRLRGLHQPARGGDRRPLPRGVRALRAPSGLPGRGGGLGARGRRGGGGSAAGGLEPHDAGPPAPRAAGPGAPARQGAPLPGR